nr:ATP-binding cassette domain-containing protein [uncultured Acetatifactor sp.]
MIEIKNLGGAKVRALDGISLTIGDDEFLAVMGSSGSGKSTLLHMIGGIRRSRGACV